MIIQYKDEYGTDMFEIVSTAVPNTGDSVILDEAEYVIKERIFMPMTDTVIIVLKDGFVKLKIAEDKENNRQSKLEHAILELNKRQDVSDKNHRLLKEQLVSVRTHINQQLRKENKNGTS